MKKHGQARSVLGFMLVCVQCGPRLTNNFFFSLLDKITFVLEKYHDCSWTAIIKIDIPGSDYYASQDLLELQYFKILWSFGKQITVSLRCKAVNYILLESYFFKKKSYPFLSFLISFDSLFINHCILYMWIIYVFQALAIFIKVNMPWL